MFEQLQRLLRGDAPTPEATTPDRHRLAAAALLVTAGMMDDEFDDAERARVLELLQTKFDLDEPAARELLAEGETLAKESVDLFGFTSAIKEGFPPEERIDVIEMVWEVIYTDGELHHLETNLTRRLAGLLGVSDRESGSARLRVRRRLGIDS
ncbi:MAG: TerB family tellurite resistance protein [Pseudomonadota bacterium]